MNKIIKCLVATSLMLIFAGCGTLPQVKAQERIFPPLALEFLAEYDLPLQEFANTPVGGLSGITYDRQTNRFFAVSDDRSNLAPARFYTLDLEIAEQANQQIGIKNIKIEDVTFLRDAEGKTYSPGTIDPEGIALSTQGSLYISSEGSPQQNIPPGIFEFDKNTGKLKQSLRIPQRYLPDPTGKKEQGVRENLAFEALTINQVGLSPVDPFRLFTATESSLLQDRKAIISSQPQPVRLLHYLINSVSPPVLIAEHCYLLDGATEEVMLNGLAELLALEQEGSWLSLERTFGLTGFGAKIFQVVTGDAPDTSMIASFADNIPKPLKKKLLLDLSNLDIDLDNLEGMTFGARLPDGSRSLILVSDNNFKTDIQVTQFLLFRIFTPE